jgi:hypothetical protein
MSGHVGLRTPSKLDQRANAFFPVKQGMDELESNGFGQHGEAAGNKVQGLIGEWEVLIHAHD